jgi:hypothetical protein
MPTEAERHDARQAMFALESKHIREAIRRIDAGELGPFSESRKFDLVVDGRRYPPKRVLGLALEEPTGKNYTPYHFKGGELTACFEALHALGYVIADKDGNELPLHAESQNRTWKYGKPAWQHALDAVYALGGRASRNEIATNVCAQVLAFNVGNIDPDLSLLTVNSFSRASYSPNQKPRRTDEGSPYDALYLDRTGAEPLYTLYSPELHGVWELAPDDEGTLRPRLVSEAALQGALQELRDEAESEGAFDPADETDARKKTLAAIVRRQGQGKFRKALLKAYEGRCAITDCDVQDTLEAAHICGYLGTHTNVVTNGLLLRADVHTLFDLGLISVEPESKRLVLASILADSQYAGLSGRVLRLPAKREDWPSEAALRKHGETALSL